MSSNKALILKEQVSSKDSLLNFVPSFHTGVGQVLGKHFG